MMKFFSLFLIVGFALIAITQGFDSSAATTWAQSCAYGILF
jgi:hypothetical protein